MIQVGVQIRALAFSENKINKVNKLLLHAYKISFTINNIKYNFCADIPKDFEYELKQKYLKIAL